MFNEIDKIMNILINAKTRIIKLLIDTGPSVFVLKGNKIAREQNTFKCVGFYKIRG